MRVLSHFWVLGIIVPLIATLYYAVCIKPIRFSQGRFFIRDDRLYMHKVRGSKEGNHPFWQDYWQEVEPLPTGGFQTKGREFKQNVGPMSRAADQPWSFPFLPATEAEIEALRNKGQVRSTTVVSRDSALRRLQQAFPSDAQLSR